MPHVINGIGTWYWGKSNIHTQPATCEFCSNFGELRSYDTTLYFVVFFIPVIPLGKRRVLDECPRCQRHRAMKLKEWERLRDQRIKEAFEAFYADRSSEDKAKSALAAVASFRDAEAFAQLAPVIDDWHLNSASVQAVYGLVLSLFGQHQQAENAYKRSLELSDDPEIRHRLAVLLLRSMRPAEAEPLVQPIIQAKERQHVGLVYLLIEAYQSQGQHDDALRVIENLCAALPDLRADQELLKYQASSQKHRLSNKRIKSSNLIPLKEDKHQRRSMAPLIPRLIAATVILSLVFLYLFAAYSKGKSRPVVLVNGLPRSYEADINGRKYTLSPKSHRIIKLPEGELKIKGQGDGIQIPEQTCRIETPFFSRPFSDRTFVINPDQVGLIAWEQTEYAEQPNPNFEPPHQLHVGQLLYEFADVEYVFEEFPQSIKLPSRTAVVQRERVHQLTLFDADRTLLLLLSEHRDKIPAYLRQYLTVNPQDAHYLRLLLGMMKPDEAVSFVQPYLDQRPLLIDWHRAYQDFMEIANPAQNLESQYRQMLAADSDNSALYYLLGRVVRDPAEAQSLFQKSVEGPSPCAYGYSAMGYTRLTQGDYAEAHAKLIKARELNPAIEGISQYIIESAKAMGNWSIALEEIRKLREKPRGTGDGIVDEACALLQLGQEPLARKSIEEFCQRLQKDDPDEATRWRTRLDAEFCHMRGDLAGFARTGKTINDPDWQLAAALCLNDVDAAAKLLADMDATSWDEHLLLFAVASRANRSDLAKQQREAAVEKLQKGTLEERQAAAWLGGLPLDASAPCQIQLIPSQKRVLLTALAFHDPRHRDQYVTAARIYNYDKTYPSLLISDLLSRAGSTSVESAAQ